MASTSSTKVPVDFKTARGNAVMVSATALAAAEEWLKRMNCDNAEVADPAVELEFDEFDNNFESDNIFGASKEHHDSFNNDSVCEETELQPDSFNEDLIFEEDEQTHRSTTPATASSLLNHTTPVRTTFVIRRSSDLSILSPATSKTPTFSSNTPTADFASITPTMTIRNHSSANKPFKTPTISAKAKAQMMANHQTNLRKRKSIGSDASSTPLTQEQRARSERNRLEALAKRRAIAKGGFSVPHTS